jgi:hypothetical protein
LQPLFGPMEAADRAYELRSSIGDQYAHAGVVTPRSTMTNRLRRGPDALATAIAHLFGALSLGAPKAFGPRFPAGPVLASAGVSGVKEPV